MELILLIIIVASVEAALVSPSNDIHRAAASTNGFQSNIQRGFNGNQLTKIELLQIAAKGDNERLMKIVESCATHGVTIASHIHQSQGGFAMNLSIGTPKPSPFSAFVDTGSDLMWTECKPCKHCLNPFDPKKSFSYSKQKCGSNKCKDFPSNISTCAKNGDCMYKYMYGADNHTFTRGVLAAETFTFEGNVSVPNLGFGCAFDIEGDFSPNQGIVGLGRGNMSLVSQMKEPRFSYCLPAFDSGETGVLSVGGGYVAAAAPRGAKATHLVYNPIRPPYYYLSLQGITIGNTRLKINKKNFEIKPNGTGGLIIDSGTTLTFLEKSAFNQVKKELTRQLRLPSFDGRSDVGLELCYNLTRPAETINFPNITFHFQGQGADFEVIPDNYFGFVDENETVGCLVMGSSPFSDGMSIFGNFQQQNALVVYDLAQNKLSFLTNTKCSTAT